MANNKQAPAIEDDIDLNGLDLYSDNARLRKLNAKLVSALAMASMATVGAFVFGVCMFLIKPDPERVAVDAAGRAFPLQLLTKGSTSDAKITRMVSDCTTNLLNHAFHNFQTTVERTIGECFTDSGSTSIRAQIDPLLQRMKTENLNLATSFVIQPFINARPVERGRQVYKVQAIVAVGYRGLHSFATPINYTLECDVVRVPYDENIEGIRMQNLVLKIKA